MFEQLNERKETVRNGKETMGRGKKEENNPKHTFLCFIEIVI